MSQVHSQMLEPEQAACPHEQTEDVSVMGGEFRLLKCAQCGLVIEKDWEEV